MIEIKNLSKEYKIYRKQEGLRGSLRSLVHREWEYKKALDALDLRIEEGEIIGLIGSNGAGKTTLVKILSGIIPSSSGEVLLYGFDPWKREVEFRKNISLVMGQKTQLWWDLPAIDCFDLIRVIYQIEKLEFKRRLDELTEDLEVKAILNIQIRRLSLGERMKMELIAALLHRPKILFLDEPSIGLDIHAQASIRKFIRGYQQKYKSIIILTSHYMEDIESLCKRVVILQTGKKVYDGGLAELRSKYIDEKKLQIKFLSEQVALDAQKFLAKTQVDSVLHGSYLDFSIKSEGLVKILDTLFSSGLEISDLSVKEPEIAEIISQLMRGTHR